MSRIVAYFGALFLFGCSSPPPLDARIWIDSTNHSQKHPAWTQGRNEAWESKGKFYIRASETVSIDDGVESCFESAEIGAQGEISVALALELRAKLNEAVLDLNPAAESLLTKVRAGEFSGRIPGLRPSEKYFERYRISELERVDCYLLSVMSREDFDKAKRAVLDRLQKLDSRLREIVERGQINFFENTPRKPAPGKDKK